ncbi:hypothetical protein Nepgr_017383 [Nepenthes gracilis]|uniref:Uncharacterized protein n=1 Tax=Nepenthes gracilis TaxID=150966 RepID=A0AAD3SSA2_NEPGR|nr:hypothetical protein Nepgr_017383 [Nepenthes gracilis]
MGLVVGFFEESKVAGGKFVCLLKAGAHFAGCGISWPVLLVWHPDACIAGLGVWRVAVGFCFYVLLVSVQEQSAVVPCRASVRILCVTPNACCILFCL